MQCACDAHQSQRIVCFVFCFCSLNEMETISIRCMMLIAILSASFCQCRSKLLLTEHISRIEKKKNINILMMRKAKSNISETSTKCERFRLFLN